MPSSSNLSLNKYAAPPLLDMGDQKVISVLPVYDTW